MASTLKHIADELGLSVMTVSRAINQTGPASSDTRRRVQAAARRLGYRPNAAARAVVRGRFKHVALLLDPDVTRSHLPADLVFGIQQQLEAEGFKVSLAQLADDQVRESRFPALLNELMVDGVLINYKIQQPLMLDRYLRKLHMPAVWIDSNRHVDCVRHDHAGGVRKLVEHLVSLGHRRIAFLDHHQADLGSPEEARCHFSLAERREGYARAMQAAGLAPWLANLGQDSSPRDRVAWTGQWLQAQGRRRPTAVIAYVPASAGPLIMAACRQGLRVPDDLSVAMASDRHEELGMQITTARMPLLEMGRAAATMLLTRIEHPRKALPAQVLAPTLVEGITCRPLTIAESLD